MICRGFSLLELMVAIAVFAGTILALALCVFSFPRVSISLGYRDTALTSARGHLAEAVRQARSSFTSLTSTPRTHEGSQAYSITVEPAEDESFVDITVQEDWTSAFGTRQEIIQSTRVVNASSSPGACDPFSSGNWLHPLLEDSYKVEPGSLLNSSEEVGSYSLAAIATAADELVLAAGSTTAASMATLFIIGLGATEPHELASFDNASTSRIGFSTLAVAPGVIFAGNAFGSASGATCSDGVSCAQVQAFNLNGASRAGVLQFSTSSPPFAYTASGSTAGVRSLTYYRGYLYVGLEKLFLGSEFVVVDAHDPAALRPVSWLRFGRSVTGITVRDGTAYLSTDDPDRELAIVDMHDPAAPQLIGSWDAPGARGFGLGTGSTARGDLIRLARNYSVDGPELIQLSIADPAHPAPLAYGDPGTRGDPESVRALLTQGRYTFTLLTHRLSVWDASAAGRLEELGFGYHLPVGDSGVALTCRNDRIYVARVSEDGSSFIDVVRGNP